jgi:hypothetical protein
MPEQILNNPDWVRTAERQSSTVGEFTGPLFDPSYTTAANPVRPGMVAAIINGVVKIANSTLDGGTYTGLFLSERTADLDESIGGTIPPVILQGPGPVKVLNAALDSGSTYAVGASTETDLVVGTGGAAGKLVPRPGANTQPAVAKLTKVMADGIEVMLLPPAQTNA